MSTTRTFHALAVLLPLLAGCGGSGDPEAALTGAAGATATVFPSVNAALQTVSDVRVSVQAGGPYGPLSADVFTYDAQAESLSVDGVPESGWFVRITGNFADSPYTIYTLARGGEAVAANELTSLAVGLVAAGEATTFAQGLAILGEDPLLGLDGDAIADPPRAAPGDSALSRAMAELAPSFRDDPNLAHDQFEPGAGDVRAVLEAMPRMRSLTLGALAYDRWWLPDAGGTGQVPAGEPAPDYLRCAGCHGWDQLGSDGGYVRRSRAPGRPNAGTGDLNYAVSRNIARGEFAADDVLHTGRGRSWGQGSASWDGTAGGYSIGNLHPDYSVADGLTAEQVENLLAFLNHRGARATAVFEQIDVVSDPVAYTVKSGASAERGSEYYAGFCAGCHGAAGSDSTAASNHRPGVGGLIGFLASDGKASEFAHKAQWGMAGTDMTRQAMGYPRASDVADLLLYLAGVEPAPPTDGIGGGENEGGDGGGLGRPEAGRARYDAGCAGCHKAGTYDASGAFADLAGSGALLVADLETLDPAMAGLSLSATEIRDLAAFLDAQTGTVVAAADDNASTLRDTAVTIDVLANDTGANLSIVAWDDLTPADGTVACARDCVYTPPAGFTGNDSFTYTLSDGNTTASARVAVVVRAGAGGDVNAGRLLYESRCAACHRAGTFDTQGQRSDLAGAGSRLVTDLGALDASMSGIALDSQQFADLAAFLDALVAPTFAIVDDEAVTAQGTPVVIDVLANDLGEALQISGWDATSGGGATIVCDQLCTYTPAPAFTGTDSFGYSAGDGNDTAVARVTVVVRTQGSAGDVDFGRLYYDNACAVCHRAATYDDSGPSSDLASRSGLLISDLGSYDAAMSGLSPSAQEILDLGAFLGSLGASPTTPAAKYEAYCASCHGAAGSGGWAGGVRGESAREIAKAIAEESEMNLPSLDALSSQDIQDIARYLEGDEDD